MGSLVHVAACPDYDRQRVTDKVRESLQATAPPDLIQPGMRVLLKPNVINDMPPERAVCTHPEIVRAVAEWVLEPGERSPLPTSRAMPSPRRRPEPSRIPG